MLDVRGRGKLEFCDSDVLACVAWKTRRHSDTTYNYDA